jgi:hypothetical protein
VFTHGRLADAPKEAVLKNHQDWMDQIRANSDRHIRINSKCLKQPHRSNMK